MKRPLDELLRDAGDALCWYSTSRVRRYQEQAEREARARFQQDETK